MNPDLDELLAAAREALSPEQVAYQRSRIRHALEVLLPRAGVEGGEESGGGVAPGRSQGQSRV